MQNKKEVSTIIGAVIIIAAAIIFFSGAIAYLNVELEKVTSMFLNNYSTASLLR
ncbi:MAG: hypothetical protein ABH856_00275 [Patescibacteria group bacterium]